MPAIRRKEQRLSSYAEKRDQEVARLNELTSDRDEIDQLLTQASEAAELQLREKRRQLAKDIKASARTLSGIDSQVEKIHQDLAYYRKERMDETQGFLQNSLDRYKQLLDDKADPEKIEKARVAVQEDNTKWGQAQQDYDITDLGFSELEDSLKDMTLTDGEKKWLNNRYSFAKTMRSMARIQIATKPAAGEAQILLSGSEMR